MFIKIHIIHVVLKRKGNKMLTLKKFKNTKYYKDNNNDFIINYEYQYKQYVVYCFKDNSKSKAFKKLILAVDYYFQVTDLNKQIKNVREVYPKQNKNFLQKIRSLFA